MKQLKEIREFMKKINKYWWEEERPDLDLKYYIPTDIICEAFEDYEIDIPDEYKENTDGYLAYLEGNNVADFGGDNTYNYLIKVQNDFTWHTFKVDNGYLVLLAFHIGGDIRGNYTKYIALQFDYEEQFLEIMNDIPYEYNLWFTLDVDGKSFDIVPIFDECLEVYDVENDENIYGIYESTDEEVKKQIKEKLRKGE